MYIIIQLKHYENKIYTCAILQNLDVNIYNVCNLSKPWC